jgi:competence protein ComEA
MRRRTASDTHASEVARRRLEALSRELGLEAPDRDVEEGPSAAPADWPRAQVGGRHALPRLGWRERLGLWMSERVPAGRDRQFGSAHLAIVAVVVAASLALGAWHLMRASATPEDAPVSAPVLEDPASVNPGSVEPGTGATGPPTATGTPAGAGGVAPGTAEAPEAPEAEIVVDVVGRVRKPGIAVLAAGSRVVDAVKAAGGMRPGTRSHGLNLARPLVDGEQIVVGPAAVPPATTSGAPGAGATSGPSSGAAPTALVNLNTADEAALDTLPGVGPVTAAAILEWRAQHGGFTAVEELLEVSGIGEATLAEIAPHVTV